MADETVYDLPRNDVDACRRFYKARGKITGEDARVMLRLQDDPAALIAAMRSWKIAE